MQNIIVLKFGSSVLRTREDLPNVVHEIYRWYREGKSVIAVVSALGKTTEALIRESRMLTESPEPFATAELLATGERTSAALLGIALDRVGVPARVVNPREIGFEVAGTPLDSEPVGLDAGRVRELLAEHAVLVVPGFFGTDNAGRTHLLGRGGSDLTAAFLAVELKARCRLLKDVDGVYETDPADVEAHPRRFAALDYQDAQRVAGKLIQPKAVSYLSKHDATCEVAALAQPYCTLVHGAGTAKASSLQDRTPIDVLILGCGTVGFGVYQRLRANPDHFRVVGILVLDRGKHRAVGIPDELLHTRPALLTELRPDLVVDCLPGAGFSYGRLKLYLSQGISVVSANKAVIAEHGRELVRIAQESGAHLAYSAAVGGSTPMLEAADRARERGEIRSVHAVLNGTCNFVLDACAAGATLSGAIAEAHRLGFAESDPRADLSGQDAANKLKLLVHHAFNIDLDEIATQALDESVAVAAGAATASGQQLRQVARAILESNHVSASIAFEAVGPESVFHALSEEWNALSLTLVDGMPVSIRGRGAGRWPTSEAILADAFEIRRDLSRHSRPRPVAHDAHELCSEPADPADSAL